MGSCCSSAHSVDLNRGLLDKSPPANSNNKPPVVEDIKPAEVKEQPKSSKSDMEIVDLRKQYDKDLLAKFYNECMIPSFGMFADELEDLSVWEGNITREEIPDRYKLHVLVIREKSAPDVLLGGVATEFYPKSGCALLTYIVTSPAARGKGVSRPLVEEVIKVMDADAKEAGFPACKAIFLETNDETKVDASADVMAPKIRQQIFEKLGFVLLKFGYVQPPLGPDKQPCDNLILGVYKRDVDKDLSFDSHTLLEWVTEFSEELQGEDYKSDANYVRMKQELESDPRVHQRKN
jgi:GNAT superfamily N-acetyltransferase